MVWILLLCHFIADYPLQTDAMVIAKKHFLGLIAHVLVHFITMLVVMVGLLKMNVALLLPGILILTGFHFGIDTWKNILSKWRPEWVIFAYLQDQVLHLVSILLVAFWMGSNSEQLSSLTVSARIIPALSIVLVTHAWFVTERVVTYRNLEYQQRVNAQSWPRMISRALMLSAWFLGWNIWALLVFCFGLTYHWLDLSGRSHTRALMIDVSVVVCIAAGLSFIYHD